MPRVEMFLEWVLSETSGIEAQMGVFADALMDGEMGQAELTALWTPIARSLMSVEFELTGGRRLNVNNVRDYSAYRDKVSRVLRACDEFLQKAQYMNQEDPYVQARIRNVQTTADEIRSAWEAIAANRAHWNTAAGIENRPPLA